jgi:hypothetical protein
MFVTIMSENENKQFLSSSLNTMGISHVLGTLGSQKDFLGVRLPSIHIYFFYTLLKEEDILRVYCLNNQSYFDIEHISKYNQWQFEEITLYAKEKILISYKDWLLENFKKDKIFNPLKLISKEAWGYYFYLGVNEYQFSDEFEGWLSKTLSKQKSLDYSKVEKNKEDLFLLTQHTFTFYSYLPRMLRFNKNIYEHPNLENDKSLTLTWL